jgi:putative ABC transport system permease protein
MGYACSFSLAKMLINSQKKFHMMPSWAIPISSISILLIVMVVLICSFAALMASYKLVMSSPALIMKNQTNSKNKKESSLSIKGLSYEWNWTLRDALRSKLRLFIGVLGVFGSVVLVLSANGLKDSVDYSNKFVYGDIFSYHTKINVEPTAKHSEIEKLSDTKGQWLQEEIVELKSQDKIETSSLTIVGKGDFVHLDSSNWSDESLIITKKLASRLGIKKNDSVQLKILKDSSFQKYKVSKIIDIPFPQGFYISDTAWKNANQSFNPTSYLVNTAISKDKAAGVTSVTTLKEQLASTNEIMKSVYSIVIAMIAASILLAIVILYNLGMLKFVEKSKEYGTLKVLGFKDSELFKLVFYDSLLPLIVGSVLGVLVGSRFMRVFVSLVSTNVRAYLPHLTILNIIVTLFIVVGCTLLVDFLIYKKVQKLNLVDSLKSSE